MRPTPTTPTDNNPTGATASNATPPPKLCMPDGCVDVTPKEHGKTLGIVGAASRKV